MDKELLAVIGKLYLDVVSLNSHVENQNQRIAELENTIRQQSSSAAKK